MFRLFLIGLILALPLHGWAAMCASVGADNVLIVNTVPIGECVGLIVLESTDWIGASVWAVPTVDDVLLIWSSAFLVPTTLFLISWSVGRVVHFFRGRG